MAVLNPVTGQFSTVRPEYVFLTLNLADYVGTARTLPAGTTLAPPLDPVSPGIREQEKQLLQLNFPHWQVPFGGRLKGWRADSRVFLISGGRLVGGLYACDANERNDDPRWGQLHYFFVEPRCKGQGAHSILVAEAIRRARSWGLEGVFINTDRFGLPEVYMRWGAVEHCRIPKVEAAPDRGSRLRRFLSAVASRLGVR